VSIIDIEMVSIGDLIIYQEARSLIINTNPLYSINNGPFPNTGLQIVERLLLLRSLRKKIV